MGKSRTIIWISLLLCKASEEKWKASERIQSVESITFVSLGPFLSPPRPHRSRHSTNLLVVAVSQHKELSSLKLFFTYWKQWGRQDSHMYEMLFLLNFTCCIQISWFLFRRKKCFQESSETITQNETPNLEKPVVSLALLLCRSLGHYVISLRLGRHPWMI